MSALIRAPPVFEEAAPDPSWVLDRSRDPRVDSGAYHLGILGLGIRASGFGDLGRILPCKQDPQHTNTP